MQEGCNSSALAMELRLSCTKQSTWFVKSLPELNITPALTPDAAAGIFGEN